VDDLSYIASVWLTGDFTANFVYPEGSIVDLLDFSVLSQEWLP